MLRQAQHERDDEFRVFQQPARFLEKDSERTNTRLHATGPRRAFRSPRTRFRIQNTPSQDRVFTCRIHIRTWQRDVAFNSLKKPTVTRISSTRPIVIKVMPSIFDPCVIGRDGASTRYFSSCPLSTRRWYCSACSLPELFQRLGAGEHHDIRRRQLVRPEVVVEEVHREQEHGGQEGFLAVHQRGHVEHPSRKDTTRSRAGRPASCRCRRSMAMPQNTAQ